MIALSLSNVSWYACENTSVFTFLVNESVMMVQNTGQKYL
jgi:hypothetical protein